jgi:hypothetical protein
MVYVPLEHQFAFVYEVLRRAMAADPAYKVRGCVVWWCDCMCEGGWVGVGRWVGVGVRLRVFW